MCLYMGLESGTGMVGSIYTFWYQIQLSHMKYVAFVAFNFMAMGDDKSEWLHWC